MKINLTIFSASSVSESNYPESDTDKINHFKEKWFASKSTLYEWIEVGPLILEMYLIMILCQKL